MSWLLSLLFGFLKPDQAAPARAAGALNGLVVWGSVVAAGAWLVGPGRSWEITLHGWEIFAVILFGVVVGIVGHIFLNMKPPGG